MQRTNYIRWASPDIVVVDEANSVSSTNTWENFSWQEAVISRGEISSDARLISTYLEDRTSFITWSNESSPVNFNFERRDGLRYLKKEEPKLRFNKDWKFDYLKLP
jgi:hypothetical protein